MSDKIDEARDKFKEAQDKFDEARDLTSDEADQEEVDELVKGPLAGGKHLYTVAWPPI